MPDFASAIAFIDFTPVSRGEISYANVLIFAVAFLQAIE